MPCAKDCTKAPSPPVVTTVPFIVTIAEAMIPAVIKPTCERDEYAIIRFESF